MYDLSYFNLGFRSDSVSDLLNGLRQKDVSNDVILNDAISIIYDCLRIEEEDILVSSFSDGEGYEMNTLYPLLNELFRDKEIKAIIDELKRVYGTVEKVKENRNDVNDEDLDHAVNFFSSLADLCLSNSAYQSVKGEISL